MKKAIHELSIATHFNIKYAACLHVTFSVFTIINTW